MEETQTLAFVYVGGAGGGGKRGGLETGGTRFDPFGKQVPTNPAALCADPGVT